MAGRKVVRGNLAALPFNNFMRHPCISFYIPYIFLMYSLYIPYIFCGNLAALPFNNFMPHPYTYIPFHMNHPHMPFQMSLFNSTYPSITSCATLYIPFHMNHPHTHIHVKSIQTNTEQFTPSVHTIPSTH